MFGRNGTALSQEERAAIAKRRGQCLKCGTKTHQVKIMGRTALTNDDAYQGICIKCNNSSVPTQILQAWQSRNAPKNAGASRLRSAAHAVRYARSANATGPPGQRRGVPPPPPGSGGTPGSGGGLINAAVTPAQGSIQRKDSRTSRYDPMNRSDSHRADAHAEVLSNSHHRTPPVRTGSDRVSGRQPSHMSSMGSSSRSTSEGAVDDYRTNPNLDSFALLKDIQDNKGKPDRIRSKLHGFRNLADDQAGAISEIKNAMEAFKNDTRLMSVAAGALWAIASKSDEKKKEIVDAGCLTVLIDMTRNGKTKDEPDTLYWAMGAISSVATLDSNKEAIVNHGGVEACLEALKRHESDATVFEWTCRALYALMIPTGEESQPPVESTVAAIESASGIRVINSAMKQHIQEDIALGWAMKVLFALQERANAASASRAVSMMNDDDLPSTCVKILKARSSSNDLLMSAMELLVLLLSASGSQINLLSAAECIPTVTRLLTDSQTTPEFVETSVRFLARVVRDNFQAKLQVAETSAVRTILQQMVSTPTNLDLQEVGFDLLWTLSADESSFDYAVLGDAKQAIDAAAAAHPDGKLLLERICGYVANVATRVSGREENIPIDLVLKLASGREASGKQAIRALSAVCAAFPSVSEGLVNDGLCDRMLEGLCDSNIDTQVSSSTMLVAMASKSEVAKSKVFDSGGLATASAALFTTTSESLAESLLLLVGTLVTGEKKAMQLPNELVQAILQAVGSFPNITKLACATIQNAMLVTVPGFTSLNADGLLDLILGIFDNPGSRDDLVIAASGALWAYTGKQPLTDTNQISKAFASILQLCARHKGDGSPYNGPLLTEAAGAFAALMHCVRENPIQIVDTDIDLIISILDIVIECDVDNVTVMERFLDVIMTLCFISKDILIQFGVIVVVIDCMVEHEANESIQQKGCAILALLASTENLQVNLSIAETDGIDMIVSALAGFTENAQVQTDACRALSHLSIDHESRMLISSQGGLILLVNAMSKYVDEADLLEAACSALLNLSSDAEEQVLAGSNVIETIIKIMREQVNAPRIQEKCLGVLQNVSMRSKDSKKSIADAGGVGAVILAINEFMGSPSVLERAFTTMWSLAVLESNQQLIAGDGGISLVINGMMANITIEKVQKQACGCLCTLSSNSQNKTLIRDLGGVDAIVYAMWAHYNSDALLVEACRALSSLAVNVQTNEVMIASEGEISAIMTALRRFPQSERLQEQGCVVLRNFLLSADNAAIVRPQAAELETLMNLAASRYPERCADRAKQVLASIS